MCTSMLAVRRVTSMSEFPTIVNCIVVSKSPILRFSVMFPLTLRKFFIIDKSNGCTFSEILDNQ